MAENRHVQHLRSRVVESNGKPKLPASSALTFGEIAVNYADNVETLSIKNENGNIVVFSSDDYYTKEKLGTAFTGSNSAFTVTEGLDEKVNNDELDDKIADAIATADTVSGAIETIVNGKLTAYSSATEIEEALSGKSDVGHHHVVADIDDFDDGVENVVSSSETITERIESVVASAITNNESVSASVSTIVEDKLTSYSSATEIDNELLKYAKKGEVDNVSEFINDVSYVTSGQVEPMVAAAISGSDAVISAITEILSDNSGITEVINNVVSGQIEGAVSGKADTSAMTLAIEEATSGKANSDDVHEWINEATSGKVDNGTFTAFTSSTETTLGNKADSSAVTESIEAATSGKVDTSVYEQFTGATEASLSGKVDNDTYTAYTAATEAVLSGKADVSDLSNYFDSVDYATSGDSHVIKFYHGETLIDYINADDFIKDGMVDNVEIADVSGVTSLIIAFNEDGGKERIVIPISDIFDASNYYTTGQTNEKFLTISAASDTYVTNANFNSAVSSAITDVNVKNDIISAVTASTEFTALNNAVTSHTSDTTVHVTSSDKTAWNAKLDQSDLNGYATEQYVQSAITEAGGTTTATVQTMIDSSISGKMDTSVFNTYSGNVDNTLTSYGTSISNFNSFIQDFDTNVSNALTSSTVSGTVDNAITNNQTIIGIQNSLNGKADVNHTHASSGVTSMRGYSKPSTSSAIETGDTLNQAIGKLEKAIETAAGGGISSVELTSGTTNGSLKIEVDGTPGNDIFVPGLGTMAYAETSNYFTKQDLTGSSTNITVYRATSATTAARLSNTSAIGSVTKPVFFTSNGVPSACTYSLGSDVPANAAFTDTATTLNGHYSPTAATNSTKNATASSTSELDWGSAIVTGVTLSGDSKGHITAVAVSSGKLKMPVTSVTTSSTSGNISVDGSDVAVAGLGTAAYRNEDYFASSGVVNTINTVSGTADAAKAVTDFYGGHSERTTLSNIPIGKRLVVVSVSSNQNSVSISGTTTTNNSLLDGYEIHVIIKNTSASDITITYPTASPYVNTTSDTAFIISGNGTGEFNFISDGTNIYMRGA